MEATPFLFRRFSPSSYPGLIPLAIPFLTQYRARIKGRV